MSWNFFVRFDFPIHSAIIRWNEKKDKKYTNLRSEKLNKS